MYVHIPKLKITVGQQISEKSQLRSLKKISGSFFIPIIAIAVIISTTKIIFIIISSQALEYFIIHMQ